MGDARLALERMQPMNFDVLAVDAFSGDSVPVHLLTREAMQLYAKHMNKNGIIAVHVSNRYLDLEPVVRAGADAIGQMALEVSDEREESDEVCYGSTWILVMRGETKAARESALTAGTEIKVPENFRPWTDSFSNLIGVLRAK
jgi:spermidine synthase